MNGSVPFVTGIHSPMVRNGSKVMQHILTHHQVLEEVNNVQKELDSQRSKLTEENKLLKTLIMVHAMKLNPTKAGGESNTPEHQSVLNDIINNERSTLLSSTMSNPDIERQAMNVIKSAEQLLATNGQGDPSVPSTNLGDVAVTAPSQEDVPMPTGTLRARQSPWKGQCEFVTSMQARGVVPPPGLTPMGRLSAPPGLCQDQRVSQDLPVHNISQGRESQAQNLNLASRPFMATKPSQMQSASRSPQTLQLTNLVTASRSSVALQPCQSQSMSGPPGSLQSAVWAPKPQQPSRVPSKWCSSATHCDSQQVDAKLFSSASTTASRLNPSQFPSDSSELAAGDSMVSTAMLCSSPFHSASGGATTTGGTHAMTSSLMQTTGQNFSSECAVPTPDLYNRGDNWSKASTCEQVAPRARLEPAPEFFCDNSWALSV